ncbi:MAG TPA: tetratricopeptide repeat protein, partial [Nannocystaceae bacterium]|nr:tetratricopeptide repeat protein [Nannocystaceae bacterium]
AVALGGTAVASAFVLASGPKVACTPSAAPRWDEHVRARLRDAFADSGDAIAGASTTVMSALDRRVTAWHDAYAQTCSDPEASAAVRTCLDVRRFELDAVADVIADGDTEVLTRALPMVAGLPGVEPCTRSPAQLAKVDPQLLVGEAQQLREKLAVARALGDAGRYDDAIATARPVLERAAAIGHAAVHAEANARLGELQVAASAPAEGATLLEEAFFEAREIGHDEVATESSIALVATLGGQLARLDAVAPWVEHAEAALQRWGSRELEAALEKARGGIALRSGDNADAVARYARTVEILAAAVDADDPRLADAIDALGIAEQLAQHWDIAIAHHERALVMREHAYGDAHPDVGYSLTNIARALLEQGLEEPAIHHNEWVIAIDEAALGSDHLFTAIAHNNLGAAWGRLGEPAAAAEQFQAARPGFERLGADHPEVALVLTNIGQAALETGDYVTAAEVLEQALAIRERHFGPDHPATRACAALLGTTAASDGAHGRAVASIERALAGDDPPAGYNDVDLVQLRITLAQSLLALRRRDDASAALVVARKAIAALDDPPPRIVADADALARAL